MKITVQILVSAAKGTPDGYMFLKTRMVIWLVFSAHTFECEIKEQWIDLWMQFKTVTIRWRWKLNSHGIFSTFDTKHRELWIQGHRNYKQSTYNKTCWLGLRSVAIHIWNWLHPTSIMYTLMWYLEDVSKRRFPLLLFLHIDLYLLIYIISWRILWR